MINVEEQQMSTNKHIQIKVLEAIEGKSNRIDVTINEKNLLKIQKKNF